MDKNKRLETIAKIAESLSNFSDSIVQKQPGMTMAEPGDGQAFYFGLLNIPEIAIARTFVSNGTAFPPHMHIEKEWVIVYKGTLNFTLEDTKITLKTGDSVVVEPNIKHEAKAVTDVWLIAITIPANEDWPSVKE
jgi:quercetin dioxygenase-like cupin family protein